jgi:hypothetical protein
MNPLLETASADAPLPTWACVAALIQAVLLCASLTIALLN